MPKINFNVPFIGEDGEPVTKIKIEKKKIKVGPKGETVPTVITDSDGNAKMEPVQVKDLLVQILNGSYQGDEALPFGDRVKRGKLAKKVAGNSTANYTVEELGVITEFSAKAGATPLLVQLDELINGDEKAANDVSEKSDEKAA